MLQKLLADLTHLSGTKHLQHKQHLCGLPSECISQAEREKILQDYRNYIVIVNWKCEFCFQDAQFLENRQWQSESFKTGKYDTENMKEVRKHWKRGKYAYRECTWDSLMRQFYEVFRQNKKERERGNLVTIKEEYSLRQSFQNNRCHSKRSL